MKACGVACTSRAFPKCAMLSAVPQLCAVFALAPPPLFCSGLFDAFNEEVFYLVAWNIER